MDGSACIRRNGDAVIGAQLHVSLSGPTVWHAWGTATIDFLGKHSVAFDLTIESGREPPPLERVDPLPPLLTALNDHRNWSAQLPAEGSALVTLRTINGVGMVLVHPFGKIAVSQRVVPLELKIEKFGDASPSNQGPFKISTISMGGKPSVSPETTKDFFAPAQFLELSNDEKVASPSFELFDSGISLAPHAITMGSSVSADFDYETAVVDQGGTLPVEPNGRAYRMPPDVALGFAPLGAAGLSAVRDSGSARFLGPAQRIDARETRYVIADAERLTDTHDIGPVTYAQAQQRLRALGGKPSRRIVVAEHELEASHA